MGMIIPAFGKYTEAWSASWTATGAAAWENKDLTALGVPANAVVEIHMYYAAIGSAVIGVREVGSALERKDGIAQYTRVTMTVQANASSIIEQYGVVTSDLSFRLLGYWS